VSFDAFLVGMSGIVVGSVLNYFILRRLFARQTTETMEKVLNLLGKFFKENPEGQEFVDMVHRLNDWTHTEEFGCLKANLFGLLESLSKREISPEEVSEPRKKESDAL